MFSLIKKIHRQYKRMRHARDAYPRLHALGPTIETLCGGPVSFIPTEGGGHDYIFYVVREKRRIAVMRLANSRFVPQDSPVETRLNGPRLWPAAVRCHGPRREARVARGAARVAVRFHRRCRG